MDTPATSKANRFFIWIAVIGGILILFAAAKDPTRARESFTNCTIQAETIFQNSINSISKTANDSASLDFEVEKLKTEAKNYRLKNLGMCNDLQAQWSISTVTYIGLLVGVLGLFTIIGTLWQTHKAARAAGDTLTVARKSMNIASQTARHELQAYLHLKNVTVRHGNDIEGTALAVAIAIENIGRTPAFNVRLECVPFSAKSRDEVCKIPAIDDEKGKIFSGYLPQSTQPVAFFTIVQGIKIEAEENYFGETIHTHNSQGYIIAEGFIEFDDIYTLANENLPKRRVNFSRILDTKDFAYGILPYGEMDIVNWKETAT